MKPQLENLDSYNAITASDANTGQTDFREFQHSGKDSQELYTFWKRLMKNETGVAKGLNLTWTVYASNYLVDATGIHTSLWRQPLGNLTKRDTDTISSNSFPVYVLQHRIRNNWIYGIPALICLSIVVAQCSSLSTQ